MIQLVIQPNGVISTRSNIYLEFTIFRFSQLKCKYDKVLGKAVSNKQTNSKNNIEAKMATDHFIL